MSIINFVDIETTGFYFKQRDRIVEFANIEYDPHEDKIISENSFLVNPNMYIPPKVSEIHGIYNKDVNHLNGFDYHSSKVAALLSQNNYIAGHNIDRFDVPFIMQELLRYDSSVPKNFYIIDTYLLAKKFIKNPEVKSFSLDNLCKHYDIDLSVRNVHDALVDCRLTLELFNKLREQYNLLDDLIFVDDEYILAKKLNYDFSPKKSFVLPKYLNAFEIDKEVIEYVQKEKPILPWLNRNQLTGELSINSLNSCGVDDKNFVPIVLLTKIGKVICQDIFIKHFIDVGWLGSNYMPTKNSIDNNIVKFKIKVGVSGNEVIYISFNQEYIREYFSTNKEVYKNLKIESVELIKSRLQK